MKKLFNPLIAVLAFLVIGLMACGPTAHIDKAPDVNLNNYKSFAWSTLKGETAKNDLAKQQVVAATERALENIGWTQSNNPDVLLSYDLLTERTVSERSDPQYSMPFTRLFYNPYASRYFRVYYPSRFMGYDRYTVEGNEGTVTITMTDAKTGKTLLQGWASNNIGSRTMTTQEADKLVKAIVQKLSYDVVKR